MTMINNYKPINFGKEYVDLNGSCQYSMFISVALGIKPCYDDWIPVNKYRNFLNVCKKYGLFVESDVINSMSKKEKINIIGGENITTTYAEGHKFNKDSIEGSVHVYVSKSKELLKKAKKFGWYPVVIDGRSINKPFVDHLRFGKILGFPNCCINFFKDYNNWKFYSHPFETLRNTPKNNFEKIGSYYCNNILMDNTYFYIHHLPCSYKCEKTIEYAKRVEKKINEVEPEFVEITNNLLKKPVLIFSEKNYILFDGTFKNNEILYENSYYKHNYARIEEKIDFLEDINQGNRIIQYMNKLYVMSDDRLLKRINMEKNWFIIPFE
jgi:hypothetical protein